MNDGTFLIEMGNKIKAARKAAKISFPQMAKATGMNVSSLWFIEAGQRNAHILTLKCIAEVLQKDIKEFL